MIKEKRTMRIGMMILGIVLIVCVYGGLNLPRKSNAIFCDVRMFCGNI